MDGLNLAGVGGILIADFLRSVSSGVTEELDHLFKP
jgi:hypothetical protein